MEGLHQDIPERKAKLENLAPVHEHLDKEFEDFVYESDKNPEIILLLLSKEINLKKKLDENRDNEKKLEVIIKRDFLLLRQ